MSFMDQLEKRTKPNTNAPTKPPPEKKPKPKPMKQPDQMNKLKSEVRVGSPKTDGRVKELEKRIAELEKHVENMLPMAIRDELVHILKECYPRYHHWRYGGYEKSAKAVCDHFRIAVDLTKTGGKTE